MGVNAPIILHLNTSRTFIKWSINLWRIVGFNKDTFSNYKSKVKQVERVYLTEEEIQTVINKDFKIERVAMVRDIFVFSWFTGVAVKFVKENGEITNNELQLVLNLSERAILRELDDLVSNNILIRKGEKKGTFYELNNSF